MTYAVPFADLTRYQGPRATTPPAADILAAIELGQTYADLSVIHGVSESTLKRRVQDSGLVARRRHGVTTAPLVAGEDPDWMAEALCAQTDPEVWFPEKGGSTLEAKRMCARCDVTEKCGVYALANDERFGVWGGMSQQERRKLLKGRKS